MEFRLLQSRAAPRCLRCGLFVCPSVRPLSVRCRLVCSPLSRWILDIPASWILSAHTAAGHKVHNIGESAQIA